jgi:DNA-binding GntR family transcriptional regulator
MTPRKPQPQAPESDEPRVQAQSLTLQVYETLRRRITEGRLGERTSLVISALVKEFGISHTPVREALARLHAEGLATFTDNIGYKVAPRPTMADYQSWMQARLIIEAGAMRQIAGEVAPDRLAQLETINAEITHTDFGTSFDGVRRFSDLNRQFHHGLILLCGNPFLARAYDQIWLGAQFSRVHIARGIIAQAMIAREHAEIIAALRSGDVASAAEMLSRHIVESLRRDAER